MVETLGYAAGACVILAFYMTDQSALRRAAVASNLLFILYALPLNLVPVIVLHAILLPLNLWRLGQLQGQAGLVREIHEPRRSTLDCMFGRFLFPPPQGALSAREALTR